MIVDVIEGVPVPVDPIAWSLEWARHNGKRVECDIRRYRRSRSAQQNRYLHGVILKVIGEELGYHADELRLALCHKFLSDIDQRTGLMRIRGTSDLSTVEFEEFASRVRQWAAVEQGIFVPLPGEYDINEKPAKEAALNG